MDFKHPSRKDDMISLCYMLLYILSGLTLPGFDAYSQALKCNDTIKVFKMVKKYKNATTL